MVAFGMIAKDGFRRALLLTGDTISRIISPYDIPANVLFGDAGTATAIEYSEEVGDSYFVAGTDGDGGSALVVEAGGSRYPRSLNTAERVPHPKDHILRSREDLYMDGPAVFGLTLRHVSNVANELATLSGRGLSSVDVWLFHQANQFMLDHFAKKMGISKNKLPGNIARFGNTSPASIPLMMVTELLPLGGDGEHATLGLVGFGVGFSWCGTLLRQRAPIAAPLIHFR
jgi:3-oxoacyl-[acyl-carrier-protein] synthase III